MNWPLLQHDMVTTSQNMGPRVYNVGNETAEGFAKTGAGRTAASEFTQETSEQLAKHGDDVARHGDDLARELDSAEAGERLAQEAEDYLKTHDMAVRENLSIKPELEAALRVKQRMQLIWNGSW